MKRKYLMNTTSPNMSYFEAKTTVHNYASRVAKFQTPNMTWQSSVDLPQRRLTMHRLYYLLQQKQELHNTHISAPPAPFFPHDTAPDTTAGAASAPALEQTNLDLLTPPPVNHPVPHQQQQEEKLLSIVRRIELALYIRAASLEEYLNENSLIRRVQYLIVSLHHQANMASSVTPTESFHDDGYGFMKPGHRTRTHSASSTASTIASSEDEMMFDEDMEEDEDDFEDFCFSNKRKFDQVDEDDLVVLPVRRNVRPRLFCSRLTSNQSLEIESPVLPICDDLLTNVFSYLDGREVVKCYVLNQCAHRVLPGAVQTLKISLTTLSSLVDAPLVGGALTNFPNLQSLEIVNSQAYNSYASNKTVPHHAFDARSCAQLPYNCNNSGETIVRDFAIGLMTGSNPKLRHLTLNSLFINTLTVNGLGAIICALKSGSCPQLESLCLGGNAIGDSGLLDVVDLLLTKNCVSQLTHLDLRRNFIGQRGLVSLASALRSGACPQLEHLLLGRNLITDEGLVEDGIISALSSGKLRKLEFLGLEDNFIEEQGITSLAKVLRKGPCPELNELCIGENSLGNSRIHRIFHLAMNSGSEI